MSKTTERNCLKKAKNHDVKMLQTIQLPLTTMQLPISNRRGGSLAPSEQKAQKMTNIFETWKLKTCVFLLGVRKQIALKMVIKLLISGKRPLSAITSLNFWLLKKNLKNDQKHEKVLHFGLKNSWKWLLTINYSLSRNFTKLSTWGATKRGYGSLMKLNDQWALPVYPVFKDEKSVNRKIA